MATLFRLYTFTPNTTISSTQVNAEFNQIVGTLNGTVTTKDVYIGSTTPPTSGTPKLFVLGQAYFQSDSSGSVLRIYRTGDADASPRIDLHNLGQMRFCASQNSVTLSSTVAVANGTLISTNSSAGNVGSGEDTLHNYTISANTLSTTTQHNVRIFAGGTTAANGNSKTIKFYVNATQIMTSGAVAFNNKPWFFDAHILSNAGASKWRVVGKFMCDTTTVYFNTEVSAIDHTVDQGISWTGTGTSDNDIVQTHFIVNKGFGLY